MKAITSTDEIKKILLETFATKTQHRGSLVGSIILEGVVVAAGATVHYIDKNRSIQSASSVRQYRPFDVIIHFGPRDSGEPLSTIRIESGGPEGLMIVSTKIRHAKRDVHQYYRAGIVAKA